MDLAPSSQIHVFCGALIAGADGHVPFIGPCPACVNRFCTSYWYAWLHDVVPEFCRASYRQSRIAAVVVLVVDVHQRTGRAAGIRYRVTPQQPPVRVVVVLVRGPERLTHRVRRRRLRIFFHGHAAAEECIRDEVACTTRRCNSEWSSDGRGRRNNCSQRGRRPRSPRHVGPVEPRKPAVRVVVVLHAPLVARRIADLLVLPAQGPVVFVAVADPRGLRARRSWRW